MNLPLDKRLKRQSHRDIARLQDVLVQIVYDLEPGAVMHGGTAIWRCFHGKRFSEDVDFYLSPKPNFQEKFTQQLEKEGAVLIKYRKTANAIYSVIRRERTDVSFETTFRSSKNPVASNYEKSDGTFLTVLTPSPEELLIEKITAFQNRKLIRDIYDVYHLSVIANLPTTERKILSKKLSTLPRPIDEENLQNILLEGAVPTFNQMIDALQRRLHA
ncbi:MAG: nucleotidyl transferase AbiEii/AbiGii toxin family protein [Candidatus Diapherotrites archaeon]